MAEPLSLKRCPICGKPGNPEFEPFCSKRCADIDLSRWLKGVYVIPAKPDEEEDDTAGPTTERPPKED
jgi:endogenous inhibitor of DNA gyrase (YacG/DUF329 family)